MQEVYDAFLEDLKHGLEFGGDLWFKSYNKELQNQFNDLYIQLEGNRKVFKLGKNYTALEKNTLN
jgi:hypothetical protein